MTVAVVSDATSDALAVNVAVVLPAATVTEAGTVTLAEPDESVTEAPPPGAAWFSVTVHVDEAGVSRVAGEQFRLAT